MSCKSQQKEMKYEVIKTDNEWREQLDQMSYLVLRKAYTILNLDFFSIYRNF